jgi:DNA-binding response OmpR family regulator
MPNLRDFLDRAGLFGVVRRVLIIEDDFHSAIRLRDFLEESGHVVFTMAGVESVEEGVLRGPALGSDEEVSVPLAGIEVIFLDHFFLSDAYTGSRLLLEIRSLTQAYVVGMSSDAAANAAIVRAGAEASMEKRALIALLGPRPLW